MSELLGHSKVDITLNLYVHSDEGQKKAAVEKVFGLPAEGGEA